MKSAYDDEAELLLKFTNADGLLIIVVNGLKGSGMVSKIVADRRVMLAMSDALRAAADDLQRQAGELFGRG